MRQSAAAAFVLPVVLAAMGGCSSLSSDPPAPYTPDPLGSGQRIAQVQDPSSATYKQATTNPNGVSVTISSAVVSWIDGFDETRDGKSVGTVYIQDVGSQAPYAGISVYKPEYIPSALRPLPGDVFDLAGPYQELTKIGAASFTPPTSLPQLAQPVASLRYEFTTPQPVVIQLSDVDQLNYGKGRQWESMLVTVEDVTVGAGVADQTGRRVTYPMRQADGGLTGSEAAISNELYDLGTTDFPAGTHFKSVTGIVTWFFSYHIAPRSPADLCTDAGCGKP